MARNIDRYFARHLSLTEEDAIKLHRDYYRNYGLALEGLVRHHQIDPLEYNSKVDDALPLEDILKPDPDLRRFLEDIDRDKVTPWLFTNAYVNHGRRVVRLLGVEDLFDGLTYCDYAQYPLVCKPSKEMYLKAMREAGAQRPEDCYFVGMFTQPAVFPRLTLHIFYRPSHGRTTINSRGNDRRFVPQLPKGRRVRLDGSAFGRRGHSSARNTSVQIPDPPSAGATNYLPSVFQVYTIPGIREWIIRLEVEEHASPGFKRILMRCSPTENSKHI